MPQQNRWEVIFMAPLVLALVLAGVWLVGNAAYENVRLSRAADQMISVVSLARDLKIPQNADTSRVMSAFVSRMQSQSIAPIVTTQSSFLDKPAQKGFMNPWDNPVSVYFYPSAQVMRFEGLFSSVACRKLLLLYAKDAGALGLRRIDIKSDDIAGVWGMVYESPKGKKNSQISEEAIYVGCKKSDDVILSLSFSL